MCACVCVSKFSASVLCASACRGVGGGGVLKRGDVGMLDGWMYVCMYVYVRGAIYVCFVPCTYVPTYVRGGFFFWQFCSSVCAAEYMYAGLMDVRMYACTHGVGVR